MNYIITHIRNIAISTFLQAPVCGYKPQGFITTQVTCMQQNTYARLHGKMLTLKGLYNIDLQCLVRNRFTCIHTSNLSAAENLRPVSTL